MLIRIVNVREISDIYYMRVVMFHKEKNNHFNTIKRIVFILLIVSVVSIVALNVMNFFINFY